MKPADFIVDIKLLSNSYDVLVEVLVELRCEGFLTLAYLAQCEHHLEEVQLTYVIVVVGIKHIKRQLLQQSSVSQ